MNLTDEQQAGITKARLHRSFALIARAGCGKTTELRAIAESQPTTRFLYLAFNKRPKEEAMRTFPRNVTVKTAHGLAFATVGKNYQHRLVSSDYQLKNDLEDRFHRAYRANGGRTNSALALMAAIEGINAFCYSADNDIQFDHVPAGPYDHALVTSICRGIWDAMENVDDECKVTHDVYLKLYQLSGPMINYDMVLYDEAHDANGCMVEVVQSSGIPTIYVLDPNQQLYAWRGAINALGLLGDIPILPLSASWRFGPELAAPANDILEALQSSPKIIGKGSSGIVVGQHNARPNAVLARTNGGIVKAAVKVVDDGGTIFIIGGNERIFGWLKAAHDLYRWNRTQHPAFGAFASWAALKEASEFPIGRSYKPFVDLVESYRNSIPEVLSKLESHTVPADVADVTLSSVHGAKGLEWDHVRFGDDFSPFCYRNTDREGPPYILDEEEANLMYVAVTRARKILELGELARVIRDSIQNVAALRRSPQKRIA